MTDPNMGEPKRMSVTERSTDSLGDREAYEQEWCSGPAHYTGPDGTVHLVPCSDLKGHVSDCEPHRWPLHGHDCITNGCGRA